MLKARCTDEHQALQHAERKVRTYRKAVLGLAGLLLLSLCGNLASAALTILVFKESRRSADAIPQRPVVLTDSKAAAPVSTSHPTSVKDTPDPSPVFGARFEEVRRRSERRGGVLGAGRPCHDGHP